MLSPIEIGGDDSMIGRARGGARGEVNPAIRRARREDRRGEEVIQPPAFLPIRRERFAIIEKRVMTGLGMKSTEEVFEPPRAASREGAPHIGQLRVAASME